MTEQVKETQYNLGQYAVTGGPGRPKGSKNKFTLIKEALAEVFEEENGKELFRAALKKKDGTLNLFALDRIIAIMPREPLVDNSTHFHSTIQVLQAKAREYGDRTPASIRVD